MLRSIKGQEILVRETVREVNTVDLHWLWQETNNRLDLLARRVSEGKYLEEALDFVKWVQFSGLIELFTAHCVSAPLKVDGAFIRWKCENLQSEIFRRYRLNDGKPHVDASELEGISRKLDLIAGRLAQIAEVSVPVTVQNARPVRIVNVYGREFPCW